VPPVEPDSSHPEIHLHVNGRDHAVRVHPMARLIDVLRFDLRLTGTKEGCGEGECGACSVFIDGALVNSCLVPAIQAVGRSIETVEGLGQDDRLRPLHDAFIERGGAQCGICTPGMIVAAAALLRRRDDADEAQVREALAGNLCRCTGYTRIVESVLDACRRVQAKESV
jgi:carbon-monoxide dehydrogenase small subunit